MTVTRLADIDGPVSPSGDRGRSMLALAALCNNAVLEGKPGKFSASGEPTENALVTAAAMQGKLKPSLERSCPRVKELPFDSTRKRMTTIHRLNGGIWSLPKVRRISYCQCAAGAGGWPGAGDECCLPDADSETE